MSARLFQGREICAEGRGVARGVSPPPSPRSLFMHFLQKKKKEKKKKRGKPAGRADRLHSREILDPGQHHFSGIKPQLVGPLLTRLREAKIGAATADRGGVGPLESEVARQLAALEEEEETVGTQAKVPRR